ncbi:NAD(P)H-dependent flavin oxidoreductase [Amphritea balenae]|uniref:Nitronate monooxygenase n=1 Tax=Amphritea balenae TaxID=452629 RepID=A0A3P1STG4_9GAMM|nr:nitronate monooxygenase [Amphritea balenae]RRD00494.1 nitronate monooxygenase [Amphritea balenae]GGK70275.1 2-nitropropane dioxygenase [Amphritea balenae]
MSITQLFDIELPIIQAPMAGVQDSALAIAVSNAGGLGSLPCAMLTPELLKKQLIILNQGTDKPVNLNFFCHSPPAPDVEREKGWGRALQPYYSEFSLDIDAIPAGAGRAPFSAAMADVIEPFRPKVVSFHFGLPDAALLDRVRSWGSKIISSATTVEEALWLEQQGVDAIIAQGLEAGGHRGIFLTTDMTTQAGTFALLPQVIAAVDLPVIAAGGIADATGVKAAMAMGAAGVQLGTAYLLCDEASTSNVHRAALTAVGAEHTALTNIFSGGPARGIVNRIMREQGPMSSDAPAFPLATTAIAPLRAAAEAQNNGDFSPLWSGQNNSGCKAIPAAELTLQLMGE